MGVTFWFVPIFIVFLILELVSCVLKLSVGKLNKRSKLHRYIQI